MKIKKHSVSKNSAFLLFGRVFDKAGALLIAILVARYLGPDQLGVYYLAFSFINIFYAIANLGIDLYLTREFSVKNIDINKLFSQGLLIKTSVSIISILLIGIVAFVSPYSPDVRLVIIFASLIIICDSIIGLFSSLFIAKELVVYDALSLLFEKGFSVIIIAISFLYTSNLLFIFSIFILFKILNMILRYLIQRKSINIKIVKFSTDDFFQTVKNNFEYALIHLFSKIYFQIDVLILSYLSTMSSIGLYQAPARLILGIMTIPQSLSVILIPIITKNYKSNEQLMLHYLKKNGRILLFLSGAFLSISFLYSNDLLILIYGDKYGPAALVFQIMSFAIPFRFINYHFEAILISLNLQRQRLIGISLVSVINLILNIIFISQYDFIGAGIVNLLTSIILTIIYFHYTPVNFSFINFFSKFCFASAGSIFIGTFFEFNFLLINIALSLIIYILLAFIIQLIKFSDIRWRLN